MIYEFKEDLPSKAILRLIETKPGVSEIYMPLNNGNYCRIGAKTEIWNKFDDGFMWHDVFHFANMAILEWSPVSRFLFGLSRKSNSRFYNQEDDFRAMIIEEAIAAFVIEEAKEKDFFEGNEKISSELLDIIESLTNVFEVKDASRSDWEKCIYQGCRVWQLTKLNRGGIIELNIEKNTIKYLGNPSLESLPKE